MRKMLALFALCVCACLALSLAGCVPAGVQTLPLPQSSGPASAAGSTSADETAETGATRPVAIVVDNLKSSRPNSGLSTADIVFETEVGGDGVTRFMALYSDYTALPVVGPVRELYMPLLECVLPAQPLLVTDAISLPCEEFLAQHEYTPYIFDVRYGKQVLWYNEKRAAATDQSPAMHQNAYTDSANLAAALQVYGTDMQATPATAPLPLATAAAPGSLPASSLAASEIHITFSDADPLRLDAGYATQFSYDEASGLYQMRQNDAEGNFTPSVDDGTSEPLAFDNILVLFADVAPRENAEDDPFHDVLDVQFANGGSGSYCIGGKALPITWEKGEADQPFRLRANGSELQLQPGTSYVAIVNVRQQGNFVLE